MRVPKLLNVALVKRKPPGRAENPVLFVAPVFGAVHKPLVDFNFPPAVVLFVPDTQFAVASKNVASVQYSASLGMCQPVGQIPRTLPANAVGKGKVLLAPFWY